MDALRNREAESAGDASWARALAEETGILLNSQGGGDGARKAS